MVKPPDELGEVPDETAFERRTFTAFVLRVVKVWKEIDSERTFGKN